MAGAIASPVVKDDLNNIFVTTNADDATKNLFDHFDDPFTTGVVARFELSQASLGGAVTEVLLFDQPEAGAPLTVQNFLNYVDGGDYTNTIIHRSISEPSLSIIQGGGFTIEGLGTTPNALRVIQPDPPVPNEFSPERSNLRGTIAMAKQEDAPNSATNQWFFNLADNSANLNNQNGGFTVFGEVLSDSDLATIDAIGQVSDFNASTLFGTEAFANIPLVFPENSITITGDDNFIRYSSITVTQREELTFIVSANSNPQLVNASVSGDQLILDYLPGQMGTADITVQATNLLGEVVEDTFLVSVNDSDLSGTNEDDEIIGSAGNDNLIGRPGDDILSGGGGDDTLSSGRGNDSLDGGDGNDSLFGRLGDDVLLGGSGNDSLDGGDGNDSLFGQLDNDILVGGDGDDTLGGGPGNDQLTGSTGNDQLRGGRGNDILNGGSGIDVLDGADDDDSLFGGEGDDTLEGGGGNDSLFGELSNDILLGGDGDDTLGGGPGNDQLTGSTGNDQLRGGRGNDVLSGSSGIDVLDGADGDDLLGGGRHRDTLIGGIGSDTFRYLALNQSLLTDGAANTFDHITDLVIGTDRIDSIRPVSAANLIQTGNVAALNETSIQAVLSAASFASSGAATFTFNSRTFLALNDSAAGYQQANDALIEITGYSGDLTTLEIV